MTNSFAYSESFEKNQFHPAHYKKRRVKEIQFFQGQHFVTQQQNQTYDAYNFFSFSGMFTNNDLVWIIQWGIIFWPNRLGFAASLIHQSYCHFSYLMRSICFDRVAPEALDVFWSSFGILVLSGQSDSINNDPTTIFRWNLNQSFFAAMYS